MSTGKQPVAEVQRELPDAADDSWAWHARELHDGVTQDIWYLQAELSCLADRVPAGLPKLRGDVDRLKKVAQDAYQELRATLNSLHSLTAPDLDLTTELAELTLRFSEALGMKVEFQCSEEMQKRKAMVPARVGREIRRLVQEALWNSWRHSKCDSAKVLVEQSGTGVTITVADGGCGFSPEKVDESHYGLSSMRERAEAIKARLYVTSGTGKGTQVMLHVPPDVLNT